MKSHLKKATSFVVASIAALIISTSAGLAGQWNMPTPYPAGSFHTQNIQQFAEEITAATDGAISIVVHPAGSLVKHAEIKNAVRSGQVQIGEFLLSRLSNENPIFEADALPFLAASYEDSRKLWRVQRKLIAEVLANQRLTVLYAVPWPPQGIYTNSVVNDITDLSGMRFRTYNAAKERLAQLAGAVPTQIEVPDIPQAFSTGRVQGMITSSTTGVNAKAWDFLDHYYDTRAFLPKNVIVVNTRALEALTTEQRNAVFAAAARAEERGWEMSREETSVQTRALGENGITVSDPSPSLRRALNEIGEKMAAEWAARAGSSGAILLDEFRKMQLTLNSDTHTD
ncbi:MAG: TRAP transporter substrate-binding protein [Pseudomonadota bacterium]